jgi:MarR family 2-MHQ and catechol resistance regulon transcriptional repressor
MDKQDTLSSDQRLALKTYVKLMRATGVVNERMHRHLLSAKLTFSQFAVLEALYHLGALCQQDIGRKILRTSGNMTMVVDNLEKRGLVVRANDPDDRRYKRVSLTSTGKVLIGRIFPRHAEITNLVFSALTPKEQKQLGALLKKLGTAVA